MVKKNEEMKKFKKGGKEKGILSRTLSVLVAAAMSAGAFAAGVGFTGKLAQEEVLAAGQLRQEGNENTFTNNMKLTSVTIDVDALDPANAPEPVIVNSKFKAVKEVVYADPNDPNSTILSEGYSVHYVGLNDSDKGKTLSCNGQCFYYVYKNAATLSDRTKADVIISYSDVNLYVSEYAAGSSSEAGSGSPQGDVIVAQGTNMRSGTWVADPSSATGKSWYVGVEETANIYIVKNGEPVEGEMLFSMRGINVPRALQEDGTVNTKNNYGRIPDAVKKHGWAEQVEVFKDNLSDDIFYPSDGYEYTGVQNGTDQALFFAKKSRGPNDSYTTGFASSAYAGKGLKVTFRVGTGYNVNSQEINNRIYPDSSFIYAIDSSTTPGGNIQTTRDGNHRGNLNLVDADDAVLEPGYYSVPRNKDVTYTMTQKPGYKIDKVIIDGADKTVEVKNTESTNSDGLKCYTYEFEDIQSDHVIHVAWKPINASVEATKKWEDFDDAFSTRGAVLPLTFHLNSSSVDSKGIIHEYPVDYYLPAQKIESSTSGASVIWGEDKTDFTAADGTTVYKGYDETDKIKYPDGIQNYTGPADVQSVTLWRNEFFYDYDYDTRKFTKYKYNTDTDKYDIVSTYDYLNYLPKYDENSSLINYTIKEDKLKNYDTTYELTDNGDEADPNKGTFKYNVTNKLNPVGTVQIVVDKNLDGRAFEANDKFTFVLSGENGAPMPIEAAVAPGSGTKPVPKDVLASITNGDGFTANTVKGEAKFDLIAYNAEDLYRVEVTYGSTDITKKERDSVRYWNVKGTDGKETTYDINDTATDSLIGKVAFDALEDTVKNGAKGELCKSLFVYHISEKPTDSVSNGVDKDTAPVSNDTKSQKIQVNVLFDQINNSILVGAEKEGDAFTVGKDATVRDPADLSNAKVTLNPVFFENTYESKGSWIPTAVKKLTGRPLEKDQFRFQIDENTLQNEKDSKDRKWVVANAPLPDKGNVSLIQYVTADSKTATKGTNNVSGPVNFGKIEFTNALLEKKTKYSEASDAEKKKVISWDDGTTIYGPIPDEAKNGSDLVIDGETFEAGTITYNNATESQKDAAQGNDKSKTVWTYNGKKCTTDISDIPGSAEGTYYEDERTLYYLMWENVPLTPVNGYTYDTHKDKESAYRVAVTIKDNKDGTIGVKSVKNGSDDVTVNNPVLFTNKYETEGKPKLKATKNLGGRDFEEGDSFTFKISRPTGDTITPLPAKTTVTITPSSGDSAEIDFGEITFTQNSLMSAAPGATDPGAYNANRTVDGYYEKSFTYVIEETKETAGGITYDTSKITCVVTVREDNAGNIKVVAVNGIPQDGGNIAAGTFTNEYQASGSVNLSATKTLTGGKLAAGDFYFELIGNDRDKDGGNVADAVLDTQPNAADGKITFRTIPYNLAQVKKDAEDRICTYTAATQTASEYWTYTYKIKEIKADNRETDGITYDTHEETVTVKVTDNGDGTLTATPTYDDDGAKFENTVSKRDLTITKIWRDTEGYGTTNDDIRPQSVNLTIVADADDDQFGDDWTKEGGKRTKTVTLTKENNAVNADTSHWVMTIANLPKYKKSDGKAIKYSVTEKDSDVPENYTKTEVASFNTVINTYTPRIDITVTKKWVGKANADVTLQLVADGNSVSGKTHEFKTTDFDGTDTCTYTFEDLERFDIDTGKEIVYTVTEEVPSGAQYTNTEDGLTVTNTNIEKTKVKASKKWAGDDGHTDDRGNVKFTLYQTVDGAKKAVERSDNPKEITLSDTMEYEWSELPKYLDGKEVSYTVEETDGPSVYTASVSGNADGGYTITNTHKKGQMDIPVLLKWDDDDNRDGIRPDSVTVTIYYENGVPVTDGSGDPVTVTLSDANNWSAQFKDLPTLDDKGKDIVYTVKQNDVNEYTYKLEGDATNGFAFTDIHKSDTTSVTATKNWAGETDTVGSSLRKDVVLHLYGDINGKVVYDAGTKTITKGSTDAAVWSDIPKKYEGKALNWEIREESIFGYTSAYEWSGYNCVVTNTYTAPVTKITAVKEWQDDNNRDGKRPSSVTFELWKKVGEEDAVKVEEKLVNESTSWSATWSDLPVISEVEVSDGESIEFPVLYTVKEAGLDNGRGYSDPVVEAVAPGEFNVINTKPVIDTTTVTVKKAWVDNDDADGIRPDHITVTLKADGVAVCTDVITGDDDWTKSFSNLPLNAEGKVAEPIKYTVEETEIDGYSAAYVNTGSELVITNTHTKADALILRVTKAWEGEDGDTSSREDVVVQLMKVVEGYGPVKVEGMSKTIPAYATGADLTVEWTDLPSMEDGKKVTYTVEEEPVEGYTTTISDGIFKDNVISITVTNKKNGEEPGPGPDPDDKRKVTYLDPKASDGSMILSAKLYADQTEADKESKEKNNAPGAPSYSDFEFVGWVVNEDEFGDYILVAKYNEKNPGITKKTISYIDPQSGQIVIKSVEGDDPDLVEPPEDPVHDGLQFVGWVKGVDENGNVVFVAKYKSDCDNNKNNNNNTDPQDDNDKKGHKYTPVDEEGGDSDKKESPLTGDKNNIHIWIALLCASAAGIAITVYASCKIRGRRR